MEISIPFFERLARPSVHDLQDSLTLMQNRLSPKCVRAMMESHEIMFIELETWDFLLGDLFKSAARLFMDPDVHDPLWSGGRLSCAGITKIRLDARHGKGMEKLLHVPQRSVPLLRTPGFNKRIRECEQQLERLMAPELLQKQRLAVIKELFLTDEDNFDVLMSDSKVDRFLMNAAEFTPEALAAVLDLDKGIEFEALESASSLSAQQVLSAESRGDNACMGQVAAIVTSQVNSTSLSVFLVLCNAEEQLSMLGGLSDLLFDAQRINIVLDLSLDIVLKILYEERRAGVSLSEALETRMSPEEVLHAVELQELDLLLVYELMYEDREASEVKPSAILEKRQYAKGKLWDLVMKYQRNNEVWISACQRATMDSFQFRHFLKGAFGGKYPRTGMIGEDWEGSQDGNDMALSFLPVSPV